MNTELKDILFLDIETVGCADQYHKLSERLKTQWARKANFFKREEGQTDEDLFHERAGIYAEFGKIVVIAVGIYAENEKGELILRTKYFADHDEKKLLNDFRTTLEKMGPATRLCAHNGKEFDFPYIARRMIIKQIELPEKLNLFGKKPWEIAHLDTMELWKFGDYKHFTSPTYNFDGTHFQKEGIGVGGIVGEEVIMDFRSETQSTILIKTTQHNLNSEKKWFESMLECEKNNNKNTLNFQLLVV